jgi:WD40 repeat protein
MAEVTFLGHVGPERFDKPVTALAVHEHVLLCGHSDGTLTIWQVQTEPFGCIQIGAVGIPDNRKVDAIVVSHDFICVAAATRLSVFQWTPDDGTIDGPSGVHVLNAHCSGITGLGVAAVTSCER